MSPSSAIRRATASACVVAVTSTGCAFHGLNSLPLPGAVGRGPHAQIFHIEFANVATLEANSPVLMSDVVVGSISKITVENWHADVDIAVKPDVVVPANGVASVGQTSLLGSLHLAIDPPIGQQAEGRLQPGATIGLNDTSTYPSTEQTLSSLSAVVNGGGLGQFTDIIKTFNVVLAGRQPQIRELLTRLDNFVGVLQEQQANIVASVRELNRFAGTLAGNHDVVDRALKRIPAAISILIRQRPRLTAALEKLGSFSKTTTALVRDTKGDLVRDLTNLEPTIRSLADVGPDLVGAAVAAATLPYTQNVIDRGVRGDYMNLFATFDISIPRLKRSLFLGSRWGQEDDPEPPAPGDPYYLRYGYAPLPAEVADHLPDGFTVVPPAPLPAGAPTTVPAVGTPKLAESSAPQHFSQSSPPGVLPADLAPLDQGGR